METEITSFVLEFITKVMNIPIDLPVDNTIPVGPGGIDLDSLSLLELIARVEKEYGFKVADEDYERLATSTLGEFVAYTAEHRGARVT